MKLVLALLLTAGAYAGVIALTLRFGGVHCDRPSAPGPMIGGVILIAGCR